MAVEIPLVVQLRRPRSYNREGHVITGMRRDRAWLGIDSSGGALSGASRSGKRGDFGRPQGTIVNADFIYRSDEGTHMITAARPDGKSATEPKAWVVWANRLAGTIQIKDHVSS